MMLQRMFLLILIKQKGKLLFVFLSMGTLKSSVGARKNNLHIFGLSFVKLMYNIINKY